MATHLPISPVVWYREPEPVGAEMGLIASIPELDNWGDAVADLAAYYRQHGTGLFAKYAAFRWQNGQLVGIADADSVKLSTLVGYEWQKDALVKNTEFLLSGETALHVLLYGSRGSGKSSLVKALLNEYSHRNLRLIEVSKSELPDLPKIVELLRGVPQKFIIFVDDLSFEEDDDSFKAMKVVLEGNLTARPKNVVVYATSNRRHLIREYFTDRPAPKDNNEVHGWDTMQEKLSFSDRFGLTLTFTAADQKTYLQIVQHLAANINISTEDLEFEALQWATRHNGRSGRTARQFIDFLNSDLAVFGETKNLPIDS
jgi:predicted AAA+ superfamily ATPase